jgi:hypothetical protein
MNLEVHDERLPKKKLSHLFRRPTEDEKKSTIYNNSSGTWYSSPIDYSSIPSIIAETEKFAEASKGFYPGRDEKKSWVRHGSKLSFEVWVGPAEEFRRDSFPAKSFTVVDALSHEKLEAALAPYYTAETPERQRQAAVEKEKCITVMAAESIVLSRDTVVSRPLALKR